VTSTVATSITVQVSAAAVAQVTPSFTSVSNTQATLLSVRVN
jgi:hypothetical protein